MIYSRWDKALVYFRIYLPKEGSRVTLKVTCIKKKKKKEIV